MARTKGQLTDRTIAFKPANKQRRQALNLQQKKATGTAKRIERFRRRKEEDKDPRLREERRLRNVPVTIDKKRVWDDAIGDEDDLSLSVDVHSLKRRKAEDDVEDEEGTNVGSDGEGLEAEQDASINAGQDPDEDAELEHFLNDDGDDNDEGSDTGGQSTKSRAHERSLSSPPPKRATSPSGSTTTTQLDLAPDALAAKFPTLFDPPAEPKVLITTGIHGTVHHEAQLLTTLFPNSTYIRRSGHRFSHQFSVREISRFAANRGYTTVVVVSEWRKRPSGLTIVHLPTGPTFHFSISNWVAGSRIPDHGNPTEHHPELILTNFRTPLGFLVAHLFKSLFPPRPELEGRQVVTLLNSRDYIFVRRHRYVFRDKRPTEKSIVGADGKVMEGVEDIRAGLQELGPRFSLKIRRIDRGIQRASGQEWEWRSKSEKQRTRFQL